MRTQHVESANSKLRAYNSFNDTALWDRFDPTQCACAQCTRHVESVYCGSEAILWRRSALTISADIGKWISPSINSPFFRRCFRERKRQAMTTVTAISVVMNVPTTAIIPPVECDAAALAPPADANNHTNTKAVAIRHHT